MTHQCFCPVNVGVVVHIASLNQGFRTPEELRLEYKAVNNSTC